MQVDQWVLCVDESGKASVPCDLRVVAALLLRDPETEASRARLTAPLDAQALEWRR